MGEHAFDRVEERSILQEDVYRILERGMVNDAPEYIEETKEWKVVVVKRMPGTREAGVVTLVVADDDTLFVKTVMWMDL